MPSDPLSWPEKWKSPCSNQHLVLLIMSHHRTGQGQTYFRSHLCLWHAIPNCLTDREWDYLALPVFASWTFLPFPTDMTGYLADRSPLTLHPLPQRKACWLLLVVVSLISEMSKHIGWVTESTPRLEGSKQKCMLVLSLPPHSLIFTMQ